ncbi:MAG: hypothetical protein MPF33_10800 [Candidatus Aramenus sp.]|nr:hypothetical protein [Candidatus Aramenus sp.]
MFLPILDPQVKRVLERLSSAKFNFHDVQDVRGQWTSSSPIPTRSQ